MYTGTLIDELMRTVDRAEERAREEAELREAKLACLYAAAEQEMARFDQSYDQTLDHSIDRTFNQTLAGAA
ncbi:MAG TPA: hypothetical protein VMH85_13215 [Terriglobales bacterium]|nr:hypothetical protein [Terriglobales bacterium]